MAMSFSWELEEKMTTEDIKAMLSGYMFIKKSIKRLEDELDELYRPKKKSIIKYTPKSSENAGLDDKVVTIENIREQINEELKELMLERARVIRFISCLPKDERLVIQYKYMDGLTNEGVATKIRYSIGWVKNKHNEALVNLLNYHFPV